MMKTEIKMNFASILPRQLVPCAILLPPPSSSSFAFTTTWRSLHDVEKEEIFG
jgi:hypothetical protein